MGLTACILSKLKLMDMRRQAVSCIKLLSFLSRCHAVGLVHTVHATEMRQSILHFRFLIRHLRIHTRLNLARQLTHAENASLMLLLQVVEMSDITVLILEIEHIDGVTGLDAVC